MLGPVIKTLKGEFNKKLFDFQSSYNKTNLIQIQSNGLIDDDDEPLIIIRNTIVDFAEQAKIQKKVFINLLMKKSEGEGILP